MKPLYAILVSRSYAFLGSQGYTITLAHPDEPYMQKHGRFGEAPVPRSRHDSKMRLSKTYSHTSTCEATKSQEKNAKAENPKRKTEDGKKGTEHSSEWRDRRRGKLRRENVLPTMPCVMGFRGCYRHRPPFADLSIRQAPRWSFTCTR